MRKIREVLRLKGEHDMGACKIAWACSVSIPTVREYLNRAEAAGLGWPLPEGLGDADLEKMLFPGRVPKGEPARPLPNFAEIQRKLAGKGMTLLYLWQKYKKENPDGYGRSRFAQLYSAWEKQGDLRMLQRHKAGQKMFADWAGLTIRIKDTKGGGFWQAPVFVSAMGCSQYIFGKAYESQELRWWLRGHVDAFEDYGAVPEIVVPDNPKTGVTKPCRYEPVLNPSYAELAQFYGVAVLPARVRKPRDKAKVENAVQQVERWALAEFGERIFLSLEEANEALQGKIRAINERIMKGPNCSRKDLFEAEDRPAMRGLPGTRFEFAEWKRAKVGPDYHIQVGGHLYSVPFTLCGKHVDVRISFGTVEMFHRSVRVASHLRCIGRRPPSTIDEHMPERHRQHAEWTPARMIRWAGSVGPNTAAYAGRLMEGKAHPELGFRACMGLVNLAKKYDPARLEAACAKALALGSLTLGNVKDILAHGLENTPTHEELPPLPSHENVRGGSYYGSEEALCAKSR